MSEQEQRAFEAELRELLKRYNVRLYQDRSDWQWYFMDGWGGKIYFPITDLPQEGQPGRLTFTQSIESSRYENC